jgi:hypothetical protein
MRRFLVALLASSSFVAFSFAAEAEKNGRTLAAFAAARNEGLPALGLDFTRSIVVATPAFGPELKAVNMLVEEVEQRTLIKWSLATRLDAVHEGPTIVVGTFAQIPTLLGGRAATIALNSSAVRAEGYQLVTLASSGPGVGPLLVVAGKDARGVLFGVGHVLRMLHLGPARAGLMAPLNLATSPRYPLRGHQLGYRPKPNSYSGWDVPQWERYIRDLVIFGCNAVELIPPRSDDAVDSPHFPRPQIDMMAAMSKICAEYGLDVWVWYPALDSDYSKPETVAFALKEWGDVFSALPRLDAVLVPGGDPGRTPPRLLFPLLEKQTANLRKHHPKATMWVSPQGFAPDDMEYFFRYLQEQQPAWFAGAVFAPWVNMDLSAFRSRVPARYAVRYYPDLTHTRSCQYPVNEWDFAFAQTYGREPICPRPDDMTRLVRLLQPHTIGAVTYSEGCTDDVNKAVWAALSWNPDADPRNVLREYGRFFISERLADEFAEGLFALEGNWRGPLLLNGTIPATLERFQKLEHTATPSDLRNWRFTMALYRAYFDAAVQARFRHETALEAEALAALRARGDSDALAAMREADLILSRATEQPIAVAEHRRVYQLAEALFQSINMKLSVPLYRAVSQGRGANLDSFEWPLNNAPWLRARFAAIRGLPDQAMRATALREIVNWENPGPGGFYDDLGKPHRSPHLVPGHGYEHDPAFIHSPLVTHTRLPTAEQALRTSWRDSVGTLNAVPVSLRYSDLDPSAIYELQVVYTVEEKWRVKITANESLELQPFTTPPPTGTPVTLTIPREATSAGVLTLTWVRQLERHGSGSGMLAEVWLRKKS